MGKWANQNQVLRIGQLLIAAAPGEFTTMAGRFNFCIKGRLKNLSENSSVLQGQDVILLQASSRDCGRSVEGEVHSGGGRAGKLVHPLHHHLGGVPDPEVCLPSLCFVFLFQIVLYFPSYYVVKVLLTITDCEL